MSQDLFTHPDYYQLDELLTDEHKLIRDTVRAWIKKEVSPNIENWAKFPSVSSTSNTTTLCFLGREIMV